MLPASASVTIMFPPAPGCSTTGTKASTSHGCVASLSISSPPTWSAGRAPSEIPDIGLVTQSPREVVASDGCIRSRRRWRTQLREIHDGVRALPALQARPHTSLRSFRRNAPEQPVFNIATRDSDTPNNPAAADLLPRISRRHFWSSKRPSTRRLTRKSPTAQKPSARFLSSSRVRSTSCPVAVRQSPTKNCTLVVTRSPLPRPRP